MYWNDINDGKMYLHQAILITLKNEEFPRFGRMTQDEEFTEFRTEKVYHKKDIAKWFKIPSWMTFEELRKRNQ